ncbi:MAG: glutamine synthetase [Thermotogae bacterium]|nr:glutamine synthetase [Thermotogota bacterium]
MKLSDLLYTIEPKSLGKESLKNLIERHPNIEFISLAGVDISGNETDERIPISFLSENMEAIFDHKPVLQTDGSSIALNTISRLNDAKVDMILDLESRWYVDYNQDLRFEETELPVGTIRIPVFLMHKNECVDSRSILIKASNSLQSHLIAHLNAFYDQKDDEVIAIIPTIGTEMEFWVKTPAETISVEELRTAQTMQENYWQRTQGNVRTALEQTLLMMDHYGLQPEMGHKEVGGVKPKIDKTGHFDGIMEQIEIDWKYATDLQAVDNEVFARSLIREVFRSNKLEVTFKAKPIEGVAGSGKHTHIGLTALCRSGKKVNLFNPTDEDNYLSRLGFACLMGILKNYEIINPFVSSTTDAFKRLKPGYEAPVCVACCLGHSPRLPSRNRTVLIGLIKEIGSPMSTRFELRSPNPHTNLYLSLASIYLAILDGLKFFEAHPTSEEEMLRILSKKPWEEVLYLEKDKLYRSENDIFDDYTLEERDTLFGVHPRNVWENVYQFTAYKEKLQVLYQDQVFSPRFIEAYGDFCIKRWKTVIINRLIPEYMDSVKECVPIEHKDSNGEDLSRFEVIRQLKLELYKDTSEKLSLFSQITRALEEKEYEKASKLLNLVETRIQKLKTLYREYRENFL